MSPPRRDDNQHAMDAYPVQYTAHPYPLVVLLGLDSTDGAGEKTSAGADGDGTVIASKLPPVTSPRKDELLQDLKSLEINEDDWSGKHMRVPNALVGYRFKIATTYQLPASKTSDGHSPLSPLTPSSPLHPDGIFDPAWMSKHQDQVPCLVLAVYDFSSDASANSLNDNKLKTDIGEIKAGKGRARLAVVLLGDDSLSQAADVQERVANIRKGAGVDVFYLPSSASRAEVTTFIRSVMASLQPTCLDYYRDLTKHARRKKGRSVPSQDASRLSAHAWGIRYDVKQGVFAEFRQEMEAACRHYTSALEALMGSEGVFETSASWTVRWSEGRVLADIMAFRIIRCLLWSQMSTTAAQSWINYRDRMRELVDRRGKGSNNYGWEAWESRWAQVMAQLIERAHTSDLDLSLGQADVYTAPEKTVQSDVISPWHRLHHAGYWLRISARSARRRRKYASDITGDNNDTYLVPAPEQEPSFDHAGDIINKLSLAASAFKAQSRFHQRLQLDVGRELLRAQSYEKAIAILKPVWQSSIWRREQWWLPLFELTRVLREAAAGAGDASLLVATTFELCSPHFRHNLQLDLMSCRSKTTVHLSADSVSSFLDASFIFSADKSHVGEISHAQLAIFSSRPITLSSITTRFNRYKLELVHDPEAGGKIGLADSKPVGANLEISGQSVYLLQLEVKEAGELVLEALDLCIDSIPLIYTIPSLLLRRHKYKSSVPWKTEITPKPPKVSVSLVPGVIYTDERVKLNFEIHNEEQEAVSIQIDLLFKLDIDWETEMPLLQPGEKHLRSAWFVAPAQPTELALEATLHYTLPSDPLPLSKTVSATLQVDSPFEANYDFAPRVHPDPWPSLFQVGGMPGVDQRWLLTASLASFAAETLHIKDVTLELSSMPTGLQHTIGHSTEAYSIEPRTMREHSFVIDTTRTTTKQQRQMTVYAHVRITWARTDVDVVSTIPVSPMILPPLEPRIVATAIAMPVADIECTMLTLTLENPSQHALTFDITAPSADSLAFSGPKQQGVSLLPYSRLDVEYRMLPLVSGWTSFGIKVTDRYFAREVAVLAGEGLHTGEDGLRWLAR